MEIILLKHEIVFLLKIQEKKQFHINQLSENRFLESQFFS